MTEQENKETSDANGQENNDEANNSRDETEVESGIIRQVEYYFGDINISRDKFLLEQIQLDEGWVPIEVLTRFHRLAKMSKDIDVIAKALLNSTSGLLEVSDDNKKVRRNPELPIPEMNEERRKEIGNRTVYAKGFPLDATLDDLLKFFKQYEDVENVIMRKYQDRNTKKRMFKGSVFAMFRTKEQAEKFLALKDLKYGDKELLTLWQKSYLDQKQEEYASKKQARDKGKNKKEVAEQTDEKGEIKLPAGSVFHFSKSTEKITRENIKEALTALGAEVAYIDYKVGDSEGWVRLTKENAAKELNEKMTDGKVKIGETDVVFKLLEGEEETAYLEKTVDEMSKRRKNIKNNKYKGRNFKNKQGGRKRKQDWSDDGPRSKVKAE